MSSGTGKRRNKRIQAVCPIRLWGMDAEGRPFIEVAKALNVSRKGVQLTDVPAKLAVGNVIGLTYKEQKHKFQVVWVDKTGAAEAANVGLQSLESGNWISDVKLPPDDIDIYSRPPECEHRLLKRVRCSVSAEVSDNPARRDFVFLRDLSAGGCYAAMIQPFPLGEKVRLALWLDDETKIWADGIVISIHPNDGMGIKFLGLTRKSSDALERFQELLSQQPETPSAASLGVRGSNT